MNRRIPWIVTLAFLVVCAGWTAARAGEEDEDPVHKIMESLKSIGRTISLGFARKDKDRIVDGATQLTKAVKDLGKHYPVKDDEKGAEDFRQKSDALVKAGEDFAARAAKTKIDDAKQASALKDFYMDSVRGQCVACHNTYWVTYECESKKEKWTQAKWNDKSCPICKKKGCGVQVENEEEE